MGNGQSLGCATIGSSLNNMKPTGCELRVVSNGFIIRGYGFPEMIANTLPEALELMRKTLE